MMIWDTSHNVCRYLQTRYYCFYRWHHNVFDDRLTDIWVTNLPNISSNIFVDQGQFSDPDLSAAHIKGKMSKLLINHMTLVHIFNLKAAFIVVYIFLVIFFFLRSSSINYLESFVINKEIVISYSEPWITVPSLYINTRLSWVVIVW